MFKTLTYTILFYFLFINNLWSQVNSGLWNIVDFGAKADGITDNTKIINDVIQKCTDNGGGTVLVPAGTFVIGTLVLKSNINLQLQSGAVLLGSLNLKDYQDGRGLIFCEDAHTISITGEGTIDARGSMFYETNQNHVYKEFDKKYTRQKEKYMPENTFFSDGPLKRKPMPGMSIVFWHCTDIKINHITIKDTPVWAVRFAYCENVAVEGLTIKNNLMIPNSDGIHCTVSRNLTISNCNIVAGDDAIIVTGFARNEEIPIVDPKEQDKYVHGNKTRFAENIVVTNCMLQSRSAGIRIGYGQHPIRRCTFSNIVIYGSNRGIGIFARDVSDIEDLIFSNITIETRLHNGQWWGHGEPIHVSAITRFAGYKVGVIRNVQFNNIIATGEAGLLFYGQDSSRLENISMSDVQLTILNGKETMNYGGNFDLRPTSVEDKQIFEHDIAGIYAENVNHFRISNFDLKWGKGLPSFYTHGISCVQVNNLLINNFTGGANPNAIAGKKMDLKKSTLIK